MKGWPWARSGHQADGLAGRTHCAYLGPRVPEPRHNAFPAAPRRGEP